MQVDGAQLRAYVEYLRELGIWELYRHEGAGATELTGAGADAVRGVRASAAAGWSEPAEAGRGVMPRPVAGVDPSRGAGAGAGAAVTAATAGAVRAAVDVGLVRPTAGGSDVVVDRGSAAAGAPRGGSELEVAIPKPVPFDELAPLPEVRVRPEDRAAALDQVRTLIGDCTRCPLAYAGRRTIVFGEGDPKAQLMFVGEGPGADEDESGRPFVGKAGQLLNNMIAAMGVRREEVYIANIVKCRPPQNRVPEPVEANTCSQFLLEQIDIVQPKVIVALGATAATYLLGVKQSLSSLRGQWKSCRGAKVAVTFHPAYLLRDPRQKAEAWKDLQRVMGELGLRAPAKG